MSAMGLLHLLASVFTLSSCVTRNTVSTAPILPHYETIKDTSIGPWVNRHLHDKRLVGIWIQQFPDCSFVAKRHESKHPCMVYYIFADGRRHGLHYEPDGTIEAESWSRAPGWMLEHLDIVYRPNTLKTLIQRAKAREPTA